MQSARRARGSNPPPRGRLLGPFPGKGSNPTPCGRLLGPFPGNFPFLFWRLAIISGINSTGNGFDFFVRPRRKQAADYWRAPEKNLSSRKNLVLRREKTMIGLAYFTLVILAITGLLFNYIWEGKK